LTKIETKNTKNTYFMVPGMNGYEFVKKAKKIDKQVKVVLMTQ